MSEKKNNKRLAPSARISGAQFAFIVPPDEADRIRRAAEQSGVPVSVFFRTHAGHAAKKILKKNLDQG